ncbi:MAG: hypothetical protein J6V44_03305 [Methanobrevibacter sp.]|nr:hypothetical protein [Methanobrevibacter sp.]
MTTAEILNMIAPIIEILIAVVGFCIAVREYCKNKFNKAKKELIEQVSAYYYEEQEAVEWICQLTGENSKKIKMELRKRAQNNVENINNIYPKLTSKEAERLG